MPKPVRPSPGRNVPTPVPSRADRSNFAARGDATMTALPGVVDDMNTNVAYVDAALDYLDEQVGEADQAVADAAAQVDLAAEQVGLAAQEKEAAQAAAATAVNAPGTSGTSASVVTVGAGTKALTTQPGKSWVPGQPVVVSRAAAPATVQMYGVVLSYDAVSGAMTVAVAADGVVGSGTHADWVIALTGRRGPAGLLPVVPISVDTFGVPNICYHIMASCKLTLPPLGPTDEQTEFRNMSGLATPTVDFGSTNLTLPVTGTTAPGLITLDHVYAGVRLRSSGNATVGYIPS